MTSRITALAGAAALTIALLGTGTAPAHADTAVAGAQTSGDSLFPHQGNGGYDVSHYDVALTYAATGSITATATITASTTGGALSSYSLDLEGLTVASVTVNGAAASFTRLDDTTGTTTHKLVITPDEPGQRDIHHGGVLLGPRQPRRPW